MLLINTRRLSARVEQFTLMIEILFILTIDDPQSPLFLSNDKTNELHNVKLMLTSRGRNVCDTSLLAYERFY